MYRYPDVDDYNFLHNIRNKDWEDGGLEDQYLRECLQVIAVQDRNLVLDVGCGLGKNITKLSPYFNQVVALDPDAERLEKAKSKAAMPENLKFVLASMQEFVTEDIFDCVFCSQIIQHLHTEDVKKILTKFKNILKPKGYLILLTTNCLAAEDEFLKVNCLTNEHIPLTQKAYNECVETNDIHLPTRLFTEKTLRQLLDAAGFEIIFLKKFNGYPKIKGDNFVFARSK